MSHVVLEMANDICTRITEKSRKEVTINQLYFALSDLPPKTLTCLGNYGIKRKVNSQLLLTIIGKRRRPASQFTSRGPVQNFYQRYFTAHVLICVPKWKKVSFGFFAISSVSIPCNPCIFQSPSLRGRYSAAEETKRYKHFLKIEIAKKRKLTFFHFGTQIRTCALNYRWPTF